MFAILTSFLQLILAIGSFVTHEHISEVDLRQLPDIVSTEKNMSYLRKWSPMVAHL